MPRKGRRPRKPNKALLDNRYELRHWREAVDEIQELPEHEFRSCWPGIVVESMLEGTGVKGISTMLRAVRERYGHSGPKQRQ